MLRLFALLIALAVPTFDSPAAAPAGEALREWHAWATSALEDAPEGIEPFPALAERLRELIGKRRAEAAGLEPLAFDEGLERAAEAHAIDLLRRDFMGHEDPDGLTASDRVALLARRFVGIAGENLAEHEGLALADLEAQVGPLAVKMADGWMASEGHRENILRPDYTHDAISAFVEGDRLVIVHVFGGRSAELETALAFEQPAGGALALDVADGQPSGYAYRAHGQAVGDLVVLELSSEEIAVDPGLYQLMFLFPSGQEGSFDVANGPWIDVR